MICTIDTNDLHLSYQKLITMVFDKVNERVKQHIITELGIDVTDKKRELKNVEARCLYYSVLVNLTPSQSLAKIGRSVGKDHATVIHGLKVFKEYCFYNKELENLKGKIITLYKSSNDVHRIESIDDEIYRLEQIIKDLKKQRESIMLKTNNKDETL